MFVGGTQDIEIYSRPLSAVVTVDGAYHGKTPIVARLKRGKPHTIKLELPGYQPYEMAFTKSSTGWMFGSFCLGGCLGLLIDISTGSVYKLTPADMNVDLQKAAVDFKRGEEGIFIAVVLKAEPHWVKVGQLKAVAGR